jgi:hypothetical protein
VCDELTPRPVASPSPQLSQALIQLVVLHGAPDPADRLRRALQVAIMISSCARRQWYLAHAGAEGGQEEAESGDEDDSDLMDGLLVVGPASSREARSSGT